MTTPPAAPKIYHIVHVDKLPYIIADGCLWCDAVIIQRDSSGTTIGMSSIKERRLNQLTLSSHSGLYVGGCVPFYFCPRSVMLYIISQANHPELTYRGGQGPIVHLEADLSTAVNWAEFYKLRWAFTTSNAGANYFDDFCDLGQLHEIDWEAVRADRWSGAGIPSSLKEGKQAEFLIERCFPWELITRVGVQSFPIWTRVAEALARAQHKPKIEIKPDWYY